MKFGIVVFPGTWSEKDTEHAVSSVLGYSSRFLWHRDNDLGGVDVVIIPGGFAYGDYLRAGAIAKCSPIMDSVVEFANSGGPVFGICNGFQVLCEAGLLPGTLVRNKSLQFRCQMSYLLVENTKTIFTNDTKKGDVLKVPISHAEGNYQVKESVLEEMEQNDQVVFRYCSESGEVDENLYNPNGSIESIAGVVNKGGNVLGMMPHPERACEELLGSTSGNLLFNSLTKLG